RRAECPQRGDHSPPALDQLAARLSDQRAGRVHQETRSLDAVAAHCFSGNHGSDQPETGDLREVDSQALGPAPVAAHPARVRAIAPVRGSFELTAALTASLTHGVTDLDIVTQWA